MNKNDKVNILIIAIILIFVIIMSYSFITSAITGLDNEKMNYLTELSHKSAEGIEKLIKSDIEAINAISTFLSGSDNFNLQNSLAQLNIIKGKPFKSLGIILLDGSTFSTDKISTNLAHREYFQKAISGLSNVSDRVIDSNDGEEINVFAAPIYQGEKIVAVVFATKSQDEFSENLKNDAFGGAGYSYIINSDGRAVVNTDNPNSIGKFDNLFDIIGKEYKYKDSVGKLKSDIIQGKSGHIEFKRDGIVKQLCYSKIGVNDWYILSIVPNSVISASSEKLIMSMINIIVIIVISILIISAMINITLKKNNKTLIRLAYFDDVAQCSNWQKFNRDSKEIIARESNTNFAMIMLDVIKFKVINDVYGYKIGNTVLQCIARAIELNVFDNETFCRISGDKFNILMKYESNEIIIERLENIINSVKGCFDTYNIQFVAGIYADFEKSLSIRVVSDRSGISKSIAKRQNYEWYHFYEEENRTDILKEKKIENSMERALENEEFEVYLQPKYSLINEELYGAEALVRWNKPGTGIIYPDDFIPVFERNGFIRRLDLYMFERVCQLIARWNMNLSEFLIVPISINISRVDLLNRGLASSLKEIVDKYNVKPECIEIELVESVIFEDFDKLVDVMKSVKKEGFLVSIDDFGRGHSSLGAIKDLPVDFIKIDKSFLENIDDKGEKLITSIISMIRTLGIYSVAEGVETKEHVSFLRKSGCDIAQGFYYSKAIPVADFEKLISKSKLN